MFVYQCLFALLGFALSHLRFLQSMFFFLCALVYFLRWFCDLKQFIAASSALHLAAFYCVIFMIMTFICVHIHLKRLFSFRRSVAVIIIIITCILMSFWPLFRTRFALLGSLGLLKFS